MLRFNDIADRMLEYNPGTNLELLQRAYVFSAKVHEGQERLSGEPYLIHPLEVAGILVEMRVDDLSVAAGLLHDTLEDTLTTQDELERIFGEQVAFLVEGLTKIAKIEFTSVRERQAENFRKMLLAMSKDIRILLIKLADRLHNMRTLDFLSESARHRIAQETLDIYVPLANRLGMNWMKQELESLAFRTLKPDVVAELEKELMDGREERERYIEEVIGVLAARLSQAGMRAEITGRVKDLASIHAKMENQGVNLDQIHDVIAFRINLSGNAEQCYATLGIVHGIWRPVPGRFKDYIALPKPNGYQSIHTTVIGEYGERMEVQIRTSDMHRSAELGIAAHWKYKEGRIDTSGEEDRRFAWLRQLLEWQRELDDPHEFLDAVKVDLFPDEVFVFTPRGEVINLPTGATPVDFAYAIHSEVGEHCQGSKVNGKLVPLRTQLSDGDTVEITTNQNQVPRKDWLDFVVSSRARNKIRHSVRQAGRERSRQLGRDILERELRRVNLSLPRLLEDGQLSELAKSDVRGGTIEDLFAAVSYGKVSAASLARKLSGADETEPEKVESQVSRKLRGLFRRPKRGGSSGIVVSGVPDVLVRFGGCCDPLPGDGIIGFVTRGRGVTIHLEDCPRVFELDPERRIPVQWDSETKVPRRIKIRVRSKDQRGILATITNSISAAKVNIDAATITTGEDRSAVQNFDLWVPDVDKLNALMREIRKIKGVISVTRVRE
jgi:guanosine-3',5'-bis(diphosphate) 3'-pyrophosphohydrolase